LSDARAGLYLHVPFCARVCPYCDFAVRTGDAARRESFTAAIVGEIGLAAASWSSSFDTIYFGGGTPSQLEPRHLERILDTLRQNFDLTTDTRIFLEANPEDVTQERVADWRRLGVETLSLGIQALNPSALEFLGRAHDVATAYRAVELAAAGGFGTVSIDLIYGLPGQTAGDWRAELEQAAALEVQHISCYQLTIHDGTRFGTLARHGALVEMDDDGQGELFRLTHRHLAACGLAGYEASQFARGPEHHSRHNTKYWNHTPYLGLGPSAHSFEGRRRSWNLRHTGPYERAISLGKLPIDDREELGPGALTLEALLTGLRTYRGIDFEEIRARFGVNLLDAPSNQAYVERLVAQRLATLSGPRLVPTLEGLAVADGLAREFEVPA
jgi:putative oxygen-independent coproporphyrinogen III oxidase